MRPASRGEIVQRLRARAADTGFALGWSVAKALPEPVARRTFAAAGDLAARRNGAGVRQLRRNLRRVVGPAIGEAELDELVAAGVRSYARYWAETFRLPRMDHAAVLARTESVGGQWLDEAVARGRGVILALPHTGNWDIGALWLVAHGHPFTTVAERLKPESLFDRFVAYRESLGMEVLALTGGQRAPADVLAERLRAGRVVCLVADRDLSASGVEVSFFGEPARMPAGPALLAATTGAALLPASMWYPSEGAWTHRINPPLAMPQGRLRERVALLTQAMADVFAVDIAAHPQDWHMLQRLWLADLPPRRHRTGPAQPESAAEPADGAVLDRDTPRQASPSAGGDRG